MTELLASGIYDGWHLEEEETIELDDRVRKLYHTAVHHDGRVEFLDWSPYRHMSNLEFRRMVELGFPIRSDVASGGPLSRADLETLYNRRRDPAPGGWKRHWAVLPVQMSDGAWVWRDHYWARKASLLGFLVQRVKTRWETWESQEPLHPVVQQLLDGPIRSLPLDAGQGKSN